MAKSPGASQSHTEAFRCVVANRSMLHAYIRAIVRDAELAEDTLQDASVEIVNSWHRYDSSRPFPNWARGVARRVALANLRKHRKQPALLEADVLDAVGARLDAQGDQTRLEDRKERLQRCIQKLSGKNQELIRLRYFENRSYEEISGMLTRSVDALYVALSRIHTALLDCVQRSLGTA